MLWSWTCIAQQAWIQHQLSYRSSIRPVGAPVSRADTPLEFTVRQSELATKLVKCIKVSRQSRKKKKWSLFQNRWLCPETASLRIGVALRPEKMTGEGDPGAKLHEWEGMLKIVEIYREKAQKYFQVQRSRNSQTARVTRSPRSPRQSLFLPTALMSWLTQGPFISKVRLTRQYHHAIGKSQEEEGQWQGIRCFL